jgi:hypothetical protein
MAYSNVDVGWIEYPSLATYQSINPNYASYQLDASGEYLAWVGPVPDSGTITQIGVGVTWVFSAGDIDVRVETVDTGGLPSGTLKGTNTDVTVSVSSADNYSVKWVTLTSGASVSPNDWIAIKVRANSASTPNVVVNTTDDWQLGTPYTAYDTGTPTKVATDYPNICARYSDGSLMRTVSALMVPTSASDDSDAFTNANVLGNRFKLPFDANCIGFSFIADINADSTIRLYDSDGSTVLKSTTIYSAMARADASPYPRHMVFGSDQTLSANTWYRIGLISNDATSSEVYCMNQLEESTYGGTWWIDQAEGVAEVYHTESSSGTPTGDGDWTNSAGQICYVSVLLDEISGEQVPPTPGIFFSRGGWG